MVTESPTPMWNNWDANFHLEIKKVGNNKGRRTIDILGR